jgi:hypothetical protein
MWTTHREPAFVALMGRADGRPLAVDMAALDARFDLGGALMEDLSAATVGTPMDVLSLYHAGPGTLARWSGGAAVNDDEYPRLEFGVPFNQGMDVAERRLFLDNWMALRDAEGPRLLPPGEIDVLGPELTEAREAARLVMRSHLHMLVGDLAGRARDLRAALRHRTDRHAAGQLDLAIVRLRQLGARYLEAGRTADVRRVYTTLIEVDEERQEYREALSRIGPPLGNQPQR